MPISPEKAAANQVIREAADRDLAAARVVWEKIGLAFAQNVTAAATKRDAAITPIMNAASLACEPHWATYRAEKAIEIAKQDAGRLAYEEAWKRREILEAQLRAEETG